MLPVSSEKFVPHESDRCSSVAFASSTRAVASRCHDARRLYVDGDGRLSDLFSVALLEHRLRDSSGDGVHSAIYGADIDRGILFQ